VINSGTVRSVIEYGLPLPFILRTELMSGIGLGRCQGGKYRTPAMRAVLLGPGWVTLASSACRKSKPSEHFHSVFYSSGMKHGPPANIRRMSGNLAVLRRLTCNSRRFASGASSRGCWRGLRTPNDHKMNFLHNSKRRKQRPTNCELSRLLDFSSSEMHQNHIFP